MQTLRLGEITTASSARFVERANSLDQLARSDRRLESPPRIAVVSAADTLGKTRSSMKGSGPGDR